MSGFDDYPTAGTAYVPGELRVDLNPPIPPSGPGTPLDRLSPSVATATIRVPGGVSVGSSPQQAPTSDCRVVINNLFPSLTITLGPLGFLFCILNVVMKLIDCVNAVPKCITQLSPSPIQEALGGLALAIKCLAMLIPQISMLLMLYDILDTIIKVLACIITAVQSIADIQGEIAAAMSAASTAKDTDLMTQLTGAKSQSDIMMSQTLSVANPLAAVFALLNTFLALFGQSIPEFTVPDAGAPVAEILAPLEAIKNTLGAIKTVLGTLIGG